MLGTRADLDPTQRVLLDLGRGWAERWVREPVMAAIVWPHDSTLEDGIGSGIRAGDPKDAPRRAPYDSLGADTTLAGDVGMGIRAGDPKDAPRRALCARVCFN